MALLQLMLGVIGFAAWFSEDFFLMLFGGSPSSRLYLSRTRILTTAKLHFRKVNLAVLLDPTGREIGNLEMSYGLDLWD